MKRGNPNPSPATRFGPNRQPIRAQRPDNIMRAMRELDELNGPAAYAYLVEVFADDNQKTADRIKAAEIILEHARGKPRQSVDVAGGMQIDLIGMIDKTAKNAIANIITGGAA